jgi:ketosteroid isomerase-like protein
VNTRLYTNGVLKEKRQVKRGGVPTDRRQILQLFEDGDRALIAADVAEVRRIYAANYVQYDERGAAHNRQELIRTLTSGEIRFLSMCSTGRRIRMLRDDVAVVHGSEKDEIEQGGLRLRVNYFYMDVVRKRDGRWRIVASQLAKRDDNEP